MTDEDHARCIECGQYFSECRCPPLGYATQTKERPMTEEARANAAIVAGFIIANSELVTIKSTAPNTPIQCPPDVWRAAVELQRLLAAPSPSAEGMQALKATAIQLPIAIAFLGRGPGGENNSDPDKWAQMCASLADQLAALDAIVRAALAEKEQG